MLDPYMHMLKNWNRVNGTLDRRTYWAAVLTILVILVVLLWFADKMPAFMLLVKVFLLVMAVPYFTATVRRLHDVDRPAWNLLFLLVPVVGFFGIFLYLISDTNENSRFQEIY